MSKAILTFSAESDWTLQNSVSPPCVTAHNILWTSPSNLVVQSSFYVRPVKSSLSSIPERLEIFVLLNLNFMTKVIIAEFL